VSPVLAKLPLGKLLARELGCAFYEADDFHSKANVGKMHAGIPLTDEDRWPWLESLRELVKRCLASRRECHPGMLCPKESISPTRGHFMNRALLRSQFADLEEPRPDEDVLTVELGRTPQKLLPRTTRKNKKSKKSKKSIDTVFARLLQTILLGPLLGPKFYPHQPITTHEKEIHFTICIL